VYYLTPDERFLTVAMSDSAIDPLKARKESDRQREAALLSGVETQSGSARLTLVIFNDLQCPYCKRLHDWLQALPTDIRPHLRIVLKQFPLSMHSWAAQAAALEVCAAQQGEPQAKELEEFLLSHQETFQAQALLDQFANGVGETHLTNIPTLRECYQRGGADAVLARDRDLGDSLGVTGTPTAFLNGHKLADLSSAEQLTRTLRSALNQSTNDAFASDRSPSAVIRP
jgi:protein-disulfide isomerase